MALYIDPGINGGLAWIDDDGFARCKKMPEGMTEQADFIRSLLVACKIDRAVMEKTGTYQPGNSGPGAVTFARHCGNLEMCLYMLGIPTEQIAPSGWQKRLGVFSKEKATRKKEIKDLAQRAFPYLKVTLAVSDALGMMLSDQRAAKANRRPLEYTAKFRIGNTCDL